MTTTVLTEDIDWGNTGFDYKPTTYRFAATYKDGAWSEAAHHKSDCSGSRGVQPPFTMDSSASRA